mgnify:CR=1 FL=1
MSSGKKTLLVIATILVIGGRRHIVRRVRGGRVQLREPLRPNPAIGRPPRRRSPPRRKAPHAIVLRDMGEDVRIEPTDGDAIEVTYWTNERKSFDVSDNGGTVTVEARASRPSAS